MRKLFEEWYKKKYNFEGELRLNEDGSYYTFIAAETYEAFCAGYQQALELGGKPNGLG